MNEPASICRCRLDVDFQPRALRLTPMRQSRGFRGLAPQRGLRAIVPLRQSTRRDQDPSPALVPRAPSPLGEGCSPRVDTSPLPWGEGARGTRAGEGSPKNLPERWKCPPQELPNSSSSPRQSRGIYLWIRSRHNPVGESDRMLAYFDATAACSWLPRIHCRIVRYCQLDSFPGQRWPPLWVAR